MGTEASVRDGRHDEHAEGADEKEVTEQVVARLRRQVPPVWSVRPAMTGKGKEHWGSENGKRKEPWSGNCLVACNSRKVSFVEGYRIDDIITPCVP